jgi:periplasmic protein TonB
MKNTENFDDIIFENRNKAYGAYFLRKNYSNYLTRAMVIGSSCFILLFGGAFTYNKYIVPKLAQNNSNDGTWVILPPPTEPPIEIPEVTPPPPPERVIEQQASIKFLPPVPVDNNDEIIETPPPDPKDIEGKIISSISTEGLETDLLIPPTVAPEITKKIDLDEPDEGKVFVAVEQQPQFPDGDKALYRFLSENIHYPQAAARVNVSGKVYVKFVVEKDGSIGNVEVTKGIGFGCDEEAVRVIKLMPKWTPGKQNGKAVRVYYNMPVVYRLE